MPKAPTKKKSVHPTRMPNFNQTTSHTEEYVPQFISKVQASTPSFTPVMDDSYNPTPVSAQYNSPIVAKIAAMTPHEINMSTGLPCGCRECTYLAVSKFEPPKALLTHKQVQTRCDRLFAFASYYIDYVSRVDHKWNEKVKATWYRWVQETNQRIINHTLRQDEALMLFCINPGFEEDIHGLYEAQQKTCTTQYSADHYSPASNVRSAPYCNSASPQIQRPSYNPASPPCYNLTSPCGSP